MNEALHMHIRLMLVYGKAFHIGIRPDFIVQLGLWISIILTIQSAQFLSGSFHKMIDVTMKCCILPMNYLSNFA